MIIAGGVSRPSERFCARAWTPAHRTTAPTSRQMQALWDQVADQLAAVETIGGKNYVRRHRRGRCCPGAHRGTRRPPPHRSWRSHRWRAGTGDRSASRDDRDQRRRGHRMRRLGRYDLPRHQRNLWTGRRSCAPSRSPGSTGAAADPHQKSGGGDLPQQGRLLHPVRCGVQEMTRRRAVRKASPSSPRSGLNTAEAPQRGDERLQRLREEESGHGVSRWGPPLVKMAINGSSTRETLGGAEMHSRTSGLSDYLAVDEMDALRLVRRIVAHLRWRKLGPGPTEPDDPPIYDQEDLLGCASADVKVPFDSREILARVLDGSRFRRVQTAHGDNRSAAGAHPRLPRSGSWPTTESCSRGSQEGRAVRPVVQPDRHPRSSAHNITGSWSAPKPTGRNHPKWCQTDQRRVEFRSAAYRSDDRRLPATRQLQDITARPTTPLRLHLAQPPHRG